MSGAFVYTLSGHLRALVRGTSFVGHVSFSVNGEGAYSRMAWG